MKIVSITIVCLAIFLIMSSSHPGLAQDNIISAGCMERVKNLNPFLAQSEIELALQQLVFPPLIADFGSKKRNDDSHAFHCFLINDDNIGFPRRGGNYLEFTLTRTASNNLPPLEINPDDVVDTVKKLEMLGSRSNFSFNLQGAEKISSDTVRVQYGSRNKISKYAASLFPVVKFSALRASGGWRTGSQTFISQRDRYFLKGYSDYCYEEIFRQQNTITLAPVEAPHTLHSPELRLKTFPDYNQMVNGLRSNEIQCAFNLSALTEFRNPDDISWADMEFGRQSILYLRVTDKGLQKGLHNMVLIEFIRSQFKAYFSEQRLLSNSGWVYQFDSILSESIPAPRTSPKSNLREKTITLLYVQSTINEKVVETLRQVFRDMGLTLNTRAVDRNIAESRLKKNQFDMVMESRFINTPEFLNLKFYYHYPGVNLNHKNSINRLLSRSGDTSILNSEAKSLELRIVNVLPIVFLVRYHTRVAYRTRELNMNINDERGAPFFFHNLSQWRRTGR